MKFVLALMLFCSPVFAQVQILDTATLNSLEDGGYSLGEMLGKSKGTLAADLYKANSFYQNVADTIGKPVEHDAKTDQLPAMFPAGSGDVPEMVRLIRNFEDKGKRSDKDTKGGYYIRHLSNNSQYPYQVEFDGDEPRHFDYRWLHSKFAHFKLIAVVNRMDRADFDATNCGEVRFIYRLSYQSPKSSSSLPFFFNVVRVYPKKDTCAGYAKLWRGNPVANGALKETVFKQLEVNFQSLRFTSGYMHDFGGQAMYMLRIFRPKGGVLEPVALENTPNVLGVEKNPELLSRFVTYLKTGDNLQRLDQGTLDINFDEQFLTKLAVSWSTLGRAREANKPYSRLFKDKKAMLETIDLSGLKFIKSHDGLVERLNNMTCMGCHQSGGTAGFHTLGYPDNKFSHGFNRQELPLSPHGFAETARRELYVAALAEGKTPDRHRPHSNFPEGSTLGSGQLCLVNTAHFANPPKCASGYSCKKTVDSKDKTVLFGECVKDSQPLAGSACWQGDLKEVSTLPTDRGPIPSYNLYAFQDKWRLKGPVTQNSAYKCVLPQSGAPLGRSSRSCTLNEENFANLNLAVKIPAEICANQGGNGFDLCAASGDSGACLESRVVRAMLDTCAPGQYCREDYICQKLPRYDKISDAHYGSIKNGRRVNLSTPKQINGAVIEAAYAKQIGFCVPTYFLFNMRTDGHPSPVTGMPPGQPRIDRTKPVRGYR